MPADSTAEEPCEVKSLFAVTELTLVTGQEGIHEHRNCSHGDRGCLGILRQGHSIQ